MSLSDWITGKFLPAHAEETQRAYEMATPIDTGEARAGYSHELNSDGYVITNTVDHIVALNEGHSKQAPAGMDIVVAESMPAITARVLSKLPRN